MNSVTPCTKYLTNGPWIYLVPQFEPESVLILGYAGGTVAGLIRLLYGDNIPITGVDIKDCEPTYGVDFIKADAQDYIKTCNKYDVVVIDVFSTQNEVDPVFVYSAEFTDDIRRVCNYVIINNPGERPMTEYRKRFHSYGKNRPNRLNNHIYYFGTEDYKHLIIRWEDMQVE